MNDIHSSPESIYRNRWLAPALRRAVKQSLVLVLSGARQVGKSTLLVNEKPFSSWPYITLDDFSVSEQAERAPKSLWSDTNRQIIDEVQKAPLLFSALKVAVDEDNARRFVLSGSANLLLRQQISESLAGRATYLTLLPMTYGETLNSPVPKILANALSGKFPKAKKTKTFARPEPLMLRGMMPRLLTLHSRDAELRFWEGYVATYLERDLRRLTQIDSLVDFRRVMEAVSLRSGQLLNQTELARDTGVSQPTVFRYLNILESSALFVRLPAFAQNRTKRLIKSPKPYWLDPGLTSFLCGIFDSTALENAREKGAIFEALILLHLRSLSQLLTPSARLYYWRTTSGAEVDFVVEHGRKLLAIEVKMTDAPTYADAKHLRAFLTAYKEAAGGFVIHTGSEIKYLDENIVALPWTALCAG